MKVNVMYLGEKVFHFGKIYHVFRDKRGKEHNFGGTFRHIYFGHWYVMKDNRMNHNPDLGEGPEPSEKDRDEYEGRKLAVRQERAARQKAMELKRPHPDILRAVNLLGKFYRAMHSNDRRRFVEYLANEMSKSKGKR